MDIFEKVSVITPVYNCIKYLPKCLQSLLEQTYQNIEIILVDDGSEDGSSTLCDEYAKRFKTVKVTHQDNRGPGAARNVALSVMTGKYVTYVDADDYVAREYIETMVKLLKNYNADIAEVGLIYLYPLRNAFDSSDERILCFDGSDLLMQDYFSDRRQIRNCVGGRMYDIEKFRDIFFSEKAIGEDSEYSLKMLSKCNRLVKYNKCMYVYRAYQESLTRGTISHRHFDVVDIFLRDVAFVERLGVKLNNWEHVFLKFINVCYDLLEKLVFEKKEREFVFELENMILVFKKIEILAKKHNVILSKQLINDIKDIETWAGKYRKKNWVRLRIRRLKKNISQIVAYYKVKTLYEYKFNE